MVTALTFDDPVCLDVGRIAIGDRRYAGRRALCSGMWGVGATTHNSLEVTCLACMATPDYKLIDAIRELAKLTRSC